MGLSLDPIPSLHHKVKHIVLRRLYFLKRCTIHDHKSLPITCLKHHRLSVSGSVVHPHHLLVTLVHLSLPLLNLLHKFLLLCLYFLVGLECCNVILGQVCLEQVKVICTTSDFLLDWLALAAKDRMNVKNNSNDLRWQLALGLLRLCFRCL